MRLEDFAGVIAELVDHSASAPIGAAKLIDLRRQFGNELAATFLSVASLQPKARKKLGDGIWWVTPKSLQQATPWQVARYKADWMNSKGVFDLCCGIGGDSVALSRRGPLVAVDYDPHLLRMTEANLSSQHGSASEPTTCRAAVLCADAAAIDYLDGYFVHIDPDRRSGETRSTRPDRYEPVWDDVLRISQQASGAVVKLAPAAQIDTETSQRAHRTWISLRGSVREQSVLFDIPAAGKSGQRSAVVMKSDGTATRFAETVGELQPESKAQPNQFLIDPDAAIRAAGLTENYAATHRLSMMAGPTGFLTSAEVSVDAGLRHTAVIGHVIWSGSCDDRKLRRELRARKMYPQAIKVRGTDHDPAKMAKRLRECGDRPITLWIGRTASRRFAAMTEPLPSASKKIVGSRENPIK